MECSRKSKAEQAEDLIGAKVRIVGPKWKELLVGSIDDHTFHIEMTMGVSHVYFPTESKWEASAPAWAAGRWRAAKEAAETWCNEQNIPITTDARAWVSFPKGEKDKDKDVEQGWTPFEKAGIRWIIVAVVGAIVGKILHGLFS